MTRTDSLRRLRAARPIIAPSMLKCNFGDLAGEVERLTAAGAKLLHWDVMDGNFVPNLSYGAMLIERVRPLTGMLFDAHLMIADPAKYLAEYLKAGCDAITVHIEAVLEPPERCASSDSARPVRSLPDVARPPVGPRPVPIRPFDHRLRSGEKNVPPSDTIAGTSPMVL